MDIEDDGSDDEYVAPPAAPPPPPAAPPASAFSFSSGTPFVLGATNHAPQHPAAALATAAATSTAAAPAPVPVVDAVEVAAFDDGDDGDAPTPEASALVAPETVAVVVEEAPPAAADDGLVREAEGFRLHLSSRAATGYLGVSEIDGRFSAKKDGTTIGYYDTAVEAAVAVARHVEAAEKRQRLQAPGEQRELRERLLTVGTEVEAYFLPPSGLNRLLFRGQVASVQQVLGKSSRPCWEHVVRWREKSCGTCGGVDFSCASCVYMNEIFSDEVSKHFDDLDSFRVVRHGPPRGSGGSGSRDDAQRSKRPRTEAASTRMESLRLPPVR